jgi:hypothetical protein
LLGDRIYIATTTAQGCFLGVAVSRSADAEALTRAYGEFAQEARTFKPDYCPTTVTLDGWEPAQQAWQRLFPGVHWILCFLHSVLAVQRLCRRGSELYTATTQKLWHLFHSQGHRQFAQRLRRLTEWAKKRVMPARLRRKLLNLKTLAPHFQIAFDFPGAYRTSNLIDRLMNYQDRLLYAMQYFHGTEASANQALRAMALLWNFHPYCRRIQTQPPYSRSPFEALNGFRYHDNWLHNLLIASSLNGRGMGKPVKHKVD